LKHALDSDGFVFENSRQILEDPKGDDLRELLQGAKGYEVYTSEETHSYLRIPASALLNIASTTTRADLRECCKNRLKLLISTPEFHRFIESNPWEFYDFVAAESKDHYKNCLDPEVDEFMGRFAIRNGCRPLLEDIFREIGWSIFDILDFFDRETFYWVPGLLDGHIVYETTQETQREFMLNLCDGAFAEMPGDEVK
jgi:hypothetical protein